jgi:hypothetical protein
VLFHDGERGKYAATLLAARRTRPASRAEVAGAPAKVVDSVRAGDDVLEVVDRRSSGRLRRGLPDGAHPLSTAGSRLRGHAHSDSAVHGTDPHRFGGDHDGRGCEGGVQPARLQIKPETSSSQPSTRPAPDAPRRNAVRRPTYSVVNEDNASFRYAGSSEPGASIRVARKHRVPTAHAQVANRRGLLLSG